LGEGERLSIQFVLTPALILTFSQEKEQRRTFLDMPSNAEEHSPEKLG
jgi:hypothetical protein